MLDSKYLRGDIEEAQKRLATRNYTLDTTKIQELEAIRKETMTRTQELQAQRNSLSKSIGQVLKSGGDASPIKAQVAAISSELTSVKKRQDEVLEQLRQISLTIPNLPDASCPLGPDDSANVEVRKWGTPRTFEFPVKDHVAIGEGLGMLDFERARKVSGARFAFMTGPICKLHRALVHLMLDLHYEQGYTEVYTPYLVNLDSLYGTGQMPKFAEDLFHTSLNGDADGDDVNRHFCFLRWFCFCCHIFITYCHPGIISSIFFFSKRIYSNCNYCYMYI